MMFKTISATLLAMSVLTAPVLAATSGKTDAAPVTKQAPVKTGSKTSAKPGVLNANASMASHHTRHHKHYRHLSQHKAHKAHTKLSFRQAKPVSKRG
jgi:hypothetical protein